MAERLKARPEILDRRRESVEHPFGAIKQWMNQGAFLMRGLEKVRAEFSLTALANNLRRALNVLGMEWLMVAVAPEKTSNRIRSKRILTMIVPPIDSSLCRPVIFRGLFIFKRRRA